MTSIWGEGETEEGELQEPVPGGQGDDFFGQEISLERLEKAIQKLQRGKAVGLDQIPGEIFKSMGDQGKNRLCREFTKILRREQPVPEAWKRVRVTMVHKGHGKPKDEIGNFRPVAVTSQEYKLFMLVVKDMMEEWLEARGVLGEMQQGFRKGRQLQDNLYILIELMEIARIEGRKLRAVFMDIKGAYDRVRWQDVWDRLRQLGVGEGLIQLLINLYDGSTYDFTWEDVTVAGVKCRKGVRQGCPLSPLLFITVLSELEERVQGMPRRHGFSIRDYTGKQPGEFKIPGLFLADDIVWLGEGNEEVGILTGEATKFGNDKHWEFSDGKTKAMWLVGQGEPGVQVGTGTLGKQIVTHTWG